MVPNSRLGEILELLYSKQCILQSAISEEGYQLPLLHSLARWDEEYNSY
jgi:hypothetical protein